MEEYAFTKQQLEHVFTEWSRAHRAGETSLNQLQTDEEYGVESADLLIQWFEYFKEHPLEPRI